MNLEMSMCTPKKKKNTHLRENSTRIHNQDSFSMALDIRGRLQPGAHGTASIQTIRNKLHKILLPLRILTQLLLTALEIDGCLPSYLLRNSKCICH